MKTSRTTIARIITNQTLKSGSSKKLSQEIAAYLLGERRVGELDSLLRDVQADWAEAGYAEVLAASAHPIAPQVKADIKSHLKRLLPDAKQIIVTEVRDPDVIGGVRLSTANQQLDLTARAKLNKFKRLTTSGKD